MNKGVSEGQGPVLHAEESLTIACSDVDSKESVGSGCLLEAPCPQTPELIIWEMEIPQHLVGKFLGAHWRHIQCLKLSSGVSFVDVSRETSRDFQICHIEGTQEQVEAALTVIRERFPELDTANVYAPPLPKLPSGPGSCPRRGTAFARWRAVRKRLFRSGPSSSWPQRIQWLVAKARKSRSGKLKKKSKRKLPRQDVAATGREAAGGEVDSGSSIFPLEDGISSEDLSQNTGLSSPLPESKEDLLIVWEMEVPQYAVGRLIGKYWRHMKYMKRCSGVSKIDFLRLPDTQEFQICHIEGTQEQVDKVLTVIHERFPKLDLNNISAPPPPTLPSSPGSCTLEVRIGSEDLPQSTGLSYPLPESKEDLLIIWEMEVPQYAIPRLIGKHWRHMKYMKRCSGVSKIDFLRLPDTQELQICHIEGTQEQVDKVLTVIGRRFPELDLANIYAPPLPTLPRRPG
ncbi:uncharacterized protein LOC136771558 [Amia ocellicauda]|uniref:uncharacterized protein LOC136771558 n=1 Tax=Amia ocellicauda TaxID=2972642 RepID=UPI003463926B